MTYTFIARTCADLPVSACCRVMRVSTSGFYAWQAHPVRNKDLDDAYLSDTIVDIWTMSRRSYGSPRVHAELKLGQDVRCSRKRVERLMRQAGISGLVRVKRGRATIRVPGVRVADDLVERQFRLRPDAGLVHHSDMGSQYVSLGFGQPARGVPVTPGTCPRRANLRSGHGRVVPGACCQARGHRCARGLR